MYDNNRHKSEIHFNILKVHNLGQESWNSCIIYTEYIDTVIFSALYKSTGES